MAKYPANMATFPAITERKKFSATLANTWVTELAALQSDVVSTMANFTTLASYLSISRNQDGTLKSNVLSHNNLSNVTVNQHHLQHHASRHYGADPIRDRTWYLKGKMPANDAVKLDGIVTNATVNYVNLTSYVGNGLSLKFIYLGCTPRFVTVWSLGLGRHWVAVLGMGRVLYETTGNDNITYNSVNIVVDGFYVYDYANTGGITYYYYYMV